MAIRRKPYEEHVTRRSFAVVPAGIAFVCLEYLVALQALLAYRDHFFTVSQMRERGIDQGLPFVWHFAMWGDLFIVSGLAAYLTGRYFARWRFRRMLASLVLGFMVATALSWLYTLSAMPEAHIQNHRLTAAGVGHLFYMAIALAVFTQFFFFTEDIPTRLLLLVSVLLFLHVLIGTHMVLGVLKIIHPLSWYPPQPLTSVFGWTTVGAVGLGLALRNFGGRFNV